MYRVVCQGWIVEGRARSKQNACRLAFKKLIEADLINNTPPTDINSPSTFRNTTVEVIPDDNEPRARWPEE